MYEYKTTMELFFCLGRFGDCKRRENYSYYFLFLRLFLFCFYFLFIFFTLFSVFLFAMFFYSLLSLIYFSFRWDFVLVRVKQVVRFLQSFYYKIRGEGEFIQ